MDNGDYSAFSEKNTKTQELFKIKQELTQLDFDHETDNSSDTFSDATDLNQDVIEKVVPK